MIQLPFAVTEIARGEAARDASRRREGKHARSPVAAHECIMGEMSRAFACAASTASPTPDLELRLVDPERNAFRLWGASQCVTLFGELALSIAWGRIGAPLRRRTEVFASRDELAHRLRELLARRARHGYDSSLRALERLQTSHQGLSDNVGAHRGSAAQLGDGVDQRIGPIQDGGVDA